MLARNHRFHGHSSLNFVYRNGKTIRGPLLALKYAPNPRREDYRVAVVVSRKVNKSAVSRNRMRRRIYAIVRQLSDQITGPYDIVITVFSDNLLQEPHQNLQDQITRQLKAAGIINKSN
jgi:ribonuclease P protein component